MTYKIVNGDRKFSTIVYLELKLLGIPMETVQIECRMAEAIIDFQNLNSFRVDPGKAMTFTNLPESVSIINGVAFKLTIGWAVLPYNSSESMIITRELISVDSIGAVQEAEDSIS